METQILVIVWHELLWKGPELDLYLYPNALFFRPRGPCSLFGKKIAGCAGSQGQWLCSPRSTHLFFSWGGTFLTRWACSPSDSRSLGQGQWDLWKPPRASVFQTFGDNWKPKSICPSLEQWAVSVSAAPVPCFRPWDGCAATASAVTSAMKTIGFELSFD